MPETINIVNQIIMSVIKTNSDKQIDIIEEKVYEMIHSLYPDTIFKIIQIEYNTFNGTYICDFICNSENYRLIV